MFSFLGESFRGIIKDTGSFSGIFFLLSNTGESLELGEGSETSITVGFSKKWGVRVFDFQLMSGLMYFRKDIPRITDSVLIEAMRNIS